MLIETFRSQFQVAPVLVFTAKYGHLITPWRLLATGIENHLLVFVNIWLNVEMDVTE